MQRIIIPLLILTLACRPLVTIGLPELLLLIGIMLLLLGLPLWRFIRRYGRHKKDK